MGYSWVTAVDLNEDGSKVTLHVKVSGFSPGIPVEISGYAAQANGTVATFYDVQRMPADGQDAEMVVADIPVVSAGGGFSSKNTMVTVARAADVWITTLEEATAGPGQKAAWSAPKDGYHSCLTPTKPATPTPSW